MNDYNYVAHPNVIDAVRDACGKRYVGYGLDDECEAAVEMVRELVGKPDADVHFMTGGTMTNLTAIGAFLRPHEAVIAPTSSHIYMHETGAIEATGHKIININPVDGKVEAAAVRAVCSSHGDEHMVRPKLLFVSQTTELGTVYTLAEMRALREVCDEFGLYLYVDGARLGYALESGACDFALPELASLADAFYIGGTKNGLLFGEALVICNAGLAQEFRHLMKQRGVLLSKGFLLGIQFRAVLGSRAESADEAEGADGSPCLYFELARQANAMAVLLSERLVAAGASLMAETVSNQVFFYVSDESLACLQERVLFEVWAAKGELGTPIRFVTTWQTTSEEIEAVVGLL